MPVAVTNTAVVKCLCNFAHKTGKSQSMIHNTLFTGKKALFTRKCYINDFIGRFFYDNHYRVYYRKSITGGLIQCQSHFENRATAGC